MKDGPIKKRLRESASVSLRALAKAMSISPQHLWDLEHGNRRFTAEMQERHTKALATLTPIQNPTLAKA